MVGVEGAKGISVVAIAMTNRGRWHVVIWCRFCGEAHRYALGLIRDWPPVTIGIIPACGLSAGQPHCVRDVAQLHCGFKVVRRNGRVLLSKPRVTQKFIFPAWASEPEPELESDEETEIVEAEW